MSFGKYWNHVWKAKASKEEKWRLRCQDRGSLTNGATKLILSSYFITRLIITLLKTSARRIFGEWNYQATETWGRARRPREKLQVSQKKIPKIQTLWIFPRFATLSTAVTTTGWKCKVVGFLVFFLNESCVEKTSSEYRFGTLLSLAAAALSLMRWIL